MLKILDEKREEIAMLCKKNDVIRLEVFGSAVDGRFDPERSDVDFIVEFAPGTDLGPWLSRYFSLKDELENTLGTRVDLVFSSAITNPRFSRVVEQTRSEYYAA